jgi:hypothetical protein
MQTIHEPDVNLLEELLRRKLPELRRSWISSIEPEERDADVRQEGSVVRVKTISAE